MARLLWPVRSMATRSGTLVQRQVSSLHVERQFTVDVRDGRLEPREPYLGNHFPQAVRDCVEVATSLTPAAQVLAPVKFLSAR